MVKRVAVVGLAVLLGMGPATAPSEALKGQADAAYARGAEAAKRFLGVVGDGAVCRDAVKAGEVRLKLVELFAECEREFMEWARVKAMMPADGKMGEAKRTPAEEMEINLLMRFRPYLVAVGDEASVKMAEAWAGSGDAMKSALGKMCLAEARWLQATDGAAQLKAGDEYFAALKAADPNDFGHNLGWVLALPAMDKSVVDGRQVALFEAFPDSMLVKTMKRRALGEAGVKEFEGKPMVLEGMVVGATGEAKPFSTAQWKGKVVVVDFWATWCGPCKAALPHLKEVYAKYRGQGLEVLGVSNDYSEAALRKFLAADAGEGGMTWPNLFDAAAAGHQEWHPVSVKFGVNSIPRVFVIDRNGVCRSVEAREKLDELIPKLLAESVKE